ncbi:MAG: hypothetical protein GXP62_19535 [Oligoflexia bacterium]|nr:hypothetical protein [Oligoflexia bacterium]
MLTLPPGNESVRRSLVALAQAQRLHHCMIFEGPAGIGKLANARWLAMLINCQGPAELLGPRATPCGACWSCRHIAVGQHPDVIELGLDPQRTTPIISVRQARQLITDLSLHPFSATLRFVIIDPVDAMTAEAASALLKTFEEPPKNTTFVLVSERPMSLLATVRSRGQRVRFGPLSTDELVGWLVANAIVDTVDSARQVARLADGCPGLARSLAGGQLAVWMAARDSVVDVLRAPLPDRLAWTEKLCKGDRAAVMARVDQSVDALQRLLRDVLLACASSGPGRFEVATYNDDQSDLIDDWAARLGTRGVQRLERVLADARVDLAANVSTRLVLDAMLAGVVAQLGPERRPQS